MLKKLYLFAALTTLSFALSAAKPDRITAIQNSLTHMGREATEIVLEMKTALMLADRAEEHFKNELKQNYASAKEKCISLLTAISTSPEFATTIEQVTDAQATFIVEKNMQYKQFSAYPSDFSLEQKVDSERAIAALDQPTEQLFNIFYVTWAVITGSKMLIKKLELKKAELEAELRTLQAQTSQ